MQIVSTGLNHDESRVLEQALICTYTLKELNNVINSIAQGKWGDARFNASIKRIESLLGL